MGVEHRIEVDQVATGNLVVGLIRMDLLRVQSVELAVVQKDQVVELEVEIALVEVTTSHP